MLCWLFCLGIAPALAQQNQKIVFPTPLDYQTSAGSSIIPTSDGGYLLSGSVDGTDWSTFGMLVQPRVIKLDADLNTVWDNRYIPLSLPYGEFAFPKGDAFELPDGDFLLGLHNDSSDVHLLRLNADGSVDAEMALPATYERSAQVLDILPNGNALVFVEANQNSLKHLAPDGSEVYSINLAYNTPILLSNGHLLYVKYNFGTGTTTFFRTDNLGAPIGQTQATGLHDGVFALPNGGFGAYFKTSSIWKIRFFDDNGLETSVSANLPIAGQVSTMKSYPDGSFFASGTTVTNRGYMARFQADGTLVWAAESPEDGQSPLTTLVGIPTSDGWGAAVGGTLSDEMGFMRVSVHAGFVINTLVGNVRHDADQNCIAESGEPTIQHPRVTASNAAESFSTHANAQGEYTLLLPAGDFTVTTNPNHPFFFQCPTAPNTVSFAQGGNGSATLDMPIQSLDIIHEIRGKVTLDENDDCLADPNEPVARLWDLRLNFGNNSIHLKTNNDGEYQVFVPDGDYTLQAFPWNNYFGICGQSTRSISFSNTAAQSQTEDFVGFAEIECTKMSVSLNNTHIRPCTTAVIQVNYRNGGSIAADDAIVEVMLDPALEYESASPAPASVSGNTLYFDLGDLAPTPEGIAGHIQVRVMPSCSLQIGQQVCISANISPGTPCQDPLGWKGAIVAVEGECAENSDSIIFKIKNIGNAPNAGVLEFIIDEDEIVLLQGPFQLPVGGEQIAAVLPLSSSSTVSITAQQEPGAPGDTLVTYSLTNCVGMGGGNPSGLGGSSGPFSYNKCYAVTNSYDPNDKTASPLGFGPEHLVRHGIPLEYTIRFQNTGNDTAFLVILRDTISEKMDRGRIEILGASHAYDFSQINDSILHFRFDNILLPDSLTNPEGSQGFVSFRIYPKADLPDGTLVQNRAAIYFDQNPPIITNTVSRTYGEYFLVSTDEEINPQQVRVTVFPNPFLTETRFELLGDVSGTSYELEVFDSAGRLLRQLSFAEKTCLLRRENLSNGLHFWRVSQRGKVLASGKIVTGD